MIPKSIYSISLLLHVLVATLIKMFGIKNSISVYDLIWMRTLFAFVFLTPIIIYKKEYQQITKKNIKLNIVAGFLWALATYSLHIGLQTVPINSAAVISFLIPITIILLSSFILREKIYPKLYICVIFCTLTVAVISQPKIGSFNIGYIILCIEVLAHSLSMVFKKQLMYTQSPLLTAYISLLILMPISFILSGYNYQFLFNSQIFKIGFFIAIIYVIEFCLNHLAYKMSDASKLQPFRFFKIVYAVVISYLLLHERPTIEQAIGSCMIIIANIILIRFDIKKAKEDNKIIN